MNKSIYNSPNLGVPPSWISHATIAHPFVFISGQGPSEAKKGIEEQTEDVLNRISLILKECGSSMENVLKVTVYLSDMNNYASMNKVYAKFFTTAPPARTCIQAARIPRDVMVEIDAVALVSP